MFPITLLPFTGSQSAQESSTRSLLLSTTHSVSTSLSTFPIFSLSMLQLELCDSLLTNPLSTFHLSELWPLVKDHSHTLLPQSGIPSHYMSVPPILCLNLRVVSKRTCSAQHTMLPDFLHVRCMFIFMYWPCALLLCMFIFMYLCICNGPRGLLYVTMYAFFVYL